MEPLRRIRIKNIRGAHGTFDTETKQIEISSKLTKNNIPSKNLVYHHELGHQWILDNKISISPAKEEIFCDYLALFRCKASELSLLERQLKKVLVKKYGKQPTEQTILTILDKPLVLKN